MAGLVAGLAVVLWASPARAHAELVESDPIAGAALPEAPRAAVLAFSERVAPRLSSARLLDGSGRVLPGARTVATGDRLTVELPRLAVGAYGIAWRVVSEDDAHTTDGVLLFTVGSAPPSALASASSPSSGPRPFDVALRWARLCLLAGLAGGLSTAGFVLRRVRPPVPPLRVAAARHRLVTFAAACAALAVAAGLAELAGKPPAPQWERLWLARTTALAILAAYALALRRATSHHARSLRTTATLHPAPSRPSTASGLPSAVTTSTIQERLAILTTAPERDTSPAAGYGESSAAVSVAQVPVAGMPGDGAVGGLAGGGPQVAAREPLLVRWPVAGAVLAVPATGVVVTAEAWAGHAAALGAPAVAADAVHILTALLWLGTVTALAVLFAASPGDGRPLVRAYRAPLTRLALAGAVLAGLTGLLHALLQLAPSAAPLTSPYGRTLLVKGAIVIVVAALGLTGALRSREPRPLDAVRPRGSRVAAKAVFALAGTLHSRKPGYSGVLGSRGHGRKATPEATPFRSRERRRGDALPSHEGTSADVLGARTRGRWVAAEAVAGAVLLLAAGTLAETSPSRRPPVPVAARTRSATVTVDDLVVGLSVTPNRAGVNGFTVTATSSRRPAPAPIDGVALELPSGGTVLRPTDPGRYFGTAALNLLGPVRLTIVVHRAGARLEVPMVWTVG
ncbi:copper resistance CopC/CopD family protein [Sphaerisporangium krabiense]|uniref:Methionine-rich copper-binding protein CopC n=1 Tax=Sphaerisporangium krabiense TaxID=763782 RepID=A0A7W8ZBE5_9ACTN|nr:copper resistance protein CopC [Sphaerisporangium krabiense]MBB5630912.1 methionine-rich copper-binding protein CopC [Sphaerisporangium krabiense]